MKKQKIKTKSMAIIGVMAALYFILASYVSLKLGNLRITFASVTTILTATLLGPIEGMTVAAIGESLNQTLSYGFTPTTILWILPPMFRAGIVGLFAKMLTKNDKKPEDHKLLYPICLIIAAILTTTINTFVIWADSKIMGYYSYAYVFGATVQRFITGIVTAIAVSLIIITIIKPIRKALK